MNTQLHVRVPNNLKSKIKELAEIQGYTSEQEYFRTALREKIEQDLKKLAILNLKKLKGSEKGLKQLSKKEKEKLARSL